MGLYELLKRWMFGTGSYAVTKKAAELLDVLRRDFKNNPWLQLSEEIEEGILRAIHKRFRFCDSASW